MYIDRRGEDVNVADGTPVAGRLLAHELHDGVAHQILVGLNDLDLFSVYRNRDNGGADAKLEHARTHLRAALARVRQLASELDGGTGLQPATMTTSTAQPLTRADHARRELAVVLAEALRNALIHSDATTINVDVRATGAEIRATVADDGHGFDVGEALARGLGCGLTSMTERVRLAGGAIRVDSAPLGHTSIDISLPIKRETVAGATTSIR